MRFRGQFCYVAARLSRRGRPSPILRLRYQGSADQWGIGIELYSHASYLVFGSDGHVREANEPVWNETPSANVIDRG